MTDSADGSINSVIRALKKKGIRVPACIVEPVAVCDREFPFIFFPLPLIR